jgi:tRNA A37 methylthiotransferase MiaB
MKRQGDTKRAAEMNKRQDEEKIERVERLKELYAEWHEKRNHRKYFDMEKYLIDEPDELDSEGLW